MVAATFALRAGLGEPGACVEAWRYQADLGLLRGDDVSTPRSISPISNGPPLPSFCHRAPTLSTRLLPRPCYGERRGPISAPLAFCFPLLPSSEQAEPKVRGLRLGPGYGGEPGNPRRT